jgi:LuxR family transcriptional regulator, maltose regulon positive regulatory protein
MSISILATKLYIPPPRAKIVLRPRLIERLNEGLSSGHKLTLISASAGFGKTTLVSEWIAGPWYRPPGQVCGRPVAWLSLDEGDNDPTRFLIYLVTSLQTIMVNIGEGVLSALQAPQPPSIASILTTLLNEIATIPDNFILVLDDYHIIDSKPVDNALTFLLEHLPSQMHLVIATREDPHLPLSRLRVRGQLTELRAADLRFTPSEAAEFLNQVMGLNLSAEDIAALEARTEGWIAGLQLAALSMQGRSDAASFIKSFTGSHHFILDYLVEEVLRQRPENVQTFLLRTSILDRLCGPLCEAVLRAPAGSGQETLEYLERANLFIVPLDSERHWYRYHHLFGDLLRQRLFQSIASFTGSADSRVKELHIRASQWYEDNGLEIEAFYHAAAANDVERASRLVEGKGMPLHYRGIVGPVLHWLESLPTMVLDAKPSLWVTYASLLLFSGQSAGIEQKLQAAEVSLKNAEPDNRTQDLIGQIASMRAVLAIPLNQIETIIAQSRRALEFLHPDNLTVRTTTTWALGRAYDLQGNRAAASQAYTEAISIGQASGNIMFTLAAMTSLGNIQEVENQLYLAAETYRSVLRLFGDQPQPFTCEAHLGLARIFYEWNDVEAAEKHSQLSLQLARQVENTGTVASCGVFLARMKLAQGDVAGAAVVLAEADQFVRQNNFVGLTLEIAAAQVLTLLHQGNLAAAAHLAQTHELPISQARVLLAQGDTSAALAVLEPLRQQMEVKGWADERFNVMVLQAVAHHALGEEVKAIQLLGEVLALAEPGGFIRIFVDEGSPMAQLLLEAASRGITPGYTGKLLAAFEAGHPSSAGESPLPSSPAALPEGHGEGEPLTEPLSQRELEVLRMFKTELSGPEIARELVIALSTVRTHTKSIYSKLNVNNRRAAVKRAAELNLI